MCFRHRHRSPGDLRRCRIRLAALALVCTGAAACEQEDPEWSAPVAFDTARAWVYSGADTARLLVEVASTEEQRSYGLMMRPALDPGSGMIFLFDEVRPGTAGFWMWRTRVPLDIAFIDSAGVVRRILQMEPCESDRFPQACPSYAPDVEYWSALEVNLGWFEERGFGEGSEVRIETDPPGG